MAVMFYNFWDDEDYMYMISHSPHKFIFIGAVVIVLIGRYSALVLVIALSVFLYKKAAAMEKLDVPTPTQKQYMESIEQIQDTVEKLYSYKKEELKLKEKRYGFQQNRKIIAWMLNRKKHHNEKERQAFFKRLNPKGKRHGSELIFESKQDIYIEVSLRD